MKYMSDKSIVGIPFLLSGVYSVVGIMAIADLSNTYGNISKEDFKERNIKKWRTVVNKEVILLKKLIP